MTPVIAAIALVALTVGLWAVSRLMPIRTPIKRAEAEIAEIELEDFVLRKNMLHDRHRLAFLRNRHKHLKAMLPAAAAKPETRLLDYFSRVKAAA